MFARNQVQDLNYFKNLCTSNSSCQYNNVKLLHITWYAWLRDKHFMQWNAQSENLRENRLKRRSAEGLHKYYTDHRSPQKKQTPYCLWTTKVSFSCRHPTHLSTPCEVTFSSYLPRHMTGESSNQEDGTRGRVNIPRVKRASRLTITSHNQTDRRWDTLQGQRGGYRWIYLKHTGLFYLRKRCC